MKLKILTETSYEAIQELFNSFTQACSVVKVDCFETNNGTCDNLRITYHVFYNERPWRD